MPPADDHPVPRFSEAPLDPFPEAGPRWEPASEGELDAFLAAVDEGIADSDAGRVIPGEEITAWIRSLDTDNPLPLPRCK
jgi:hypothetical protein